MLTSCLCVACVITSLKRYLEMFVVLRGLEKRWSTCLVFSHCLAVRLVRKPWREHLVRVVLPLYSPSSTSASSPTVTTARVVVFQRLNCVKEHLATRAREKRACGFFARMETSSRLSPPHHPPPPMINDYEPSRCLEINERVRVFNTQQLLQWDPMLRIT